MISQAEWKKVWSVVREISDEYPDDIVVIGGVGVHLHASNSTVLSVEFTHDADMSVGLASWGDLREQYEVVVNRRLARAQVTIGGVEVDLYPEHNNNLRVDFGDLAMYSTVIDGVRVASLEHLLLLKLDAAADRWRSAHGAKDRRDLIKLLVLLENTEPHLVLSQATDADMDLLLRVLKSSAAVEVANGNSQAASRLRRRATVFVAKLGTEMSS